MGLDKAIPLLPGYSFPKQKSDYKKPHSLDYKNGYIVQNFKLLGIGSEPIKVNNDLVNLSELELLSSVQASNAKLLYGEKQFHSEVTTPRIVPAFVAFDKVVRLFIT